MIAIGIVPARGGSKGIPRKNIALLGGKPLLAHTAEAAGAARRLARCILSTDDPEIAAAGREYGLDVPFLRPPELATDTTPSLDVMIHAARRLDEMGTPADALVLLQPTAPLRTAEDIDGAIDLLERGEADSVVSVAEVPSHYSPEWQLTLGGDGELSLATGRPLREIVTRRQLLPKTYYRNGAVYAVRRATLLDQRSLYGERCLGYVMPAERSVNIDGPDELAEAERVLAEIHGECCV
jgi:CMP-N-acetylneuraminic acid synthetase